MNGKVVGVFVGFIAAGWAGEATAETFEVSVRSGSKQRVHMYMSWKRDCAPNTGVVKVLMKPAHGKLFPSDVDAIVKQNRFRANDPCIGKPMRGFQVDYQSEPGYRGSDIFKIEASYGVNRRVIDVYKVTVN